MTNDRKPLPEDDFVGNAAPFVLKITLEYPPRETESLLGFMPKEGKTFYDFESLFSQITKRTNRLFIS